MAEESKTPPTPEVETQTAGDGRTQLPAAPPFTFDTADLSTTYANHCHMTFTPEELILDFGLNTNLGPASPLPIKLTSRVVMNFYTAKRMERALQLAVSRCEILYGPLELDYQRRLRVPPSVEAQPASGATGSPQ